MLREPLPSACQPAVPATTPFPSPLPRPAAHREGGGGDAVLPRRRQGAPLHGDVRHGRQRTRTHRRLPVAEVGGGGANAGARRQRRAARPPSVACQRRHRPLLPPSCLAPHPPLIRRCPRWPPGGGAGVGGRAAAPTAASGGGVAATAARGRGRWRHDASPAVNAVRSAVVTHAARLMLHRRQVARQRCERAVGAAGGRPPLKWVSLQQGQAKPANGRRSGFKTSRSALQEGAVGEDGLERAGRGMANGATSADLIHCGERSARPLPHYCCLQTYKIAYNSLQAAEQQPRLGATCFRRPSQQPGSSGALNRPAEGIASVPAPPGLATVAEADTDAASDEQQGLAGLGGFQQVCSMHVVDFQVASCPMQPLPSPAWRPAADHSLPTFCPTQDRLEQPTAVRQRA